MMSLALPADFPNPPRVGEVLGRDPVPHAYFVAWGIPHAPTSSERPGRGGNCQSNPMSFAFFRRWDQGKFHETKVRLPALNLTLN